METGRPGRVQVEDLIFLIRKDPRKYSRVKELLMMNEELKKARKAFDEAIYWSKEEKTVSLNVAEMDKVQEQTEGAPGLQMRTERQPPVAQSEVKGGSGGVSWCHSEDTEYRFWPLSEYNLSYLDKAHRIVTKLVGKDTKYWISFQ